MSWAKINQSTRSLVYSLAVITLAAGVLYLGARKNSAETSPAVSDSVVPAATFAANATSLGAIPDSTNTAACGTPGLPRDVTFNVTGLSGSVTNVEVNNLTFNPVHTWRGDITATLIAPSGASHVLFGRTGATAATACGSSNDLAGPYTFGDGAAYLTTWWTIAGTPTPAGSYRTTSIGGSASGGTVTTMNTAFTGVTNANGTWTLRLTDAGSGDTGSVSAATLNVVTGPGAVPGDANVDINGDGKTDWVVTRETATPLAEGAKSGLAASPARLRSVRERQRALLEKGAETDGALAPPIYWYTNINGSGATSVGQVGDAATDFLTPEDFDGDGKDDLAVWRSGAPGSAQFIIFQSATNTFRQELFGQTGDDPQIVGDYDGDNKADPAVYRCPPFGGGDGQCFFFYRGSSNNPSGAVTFVPWGFGETFDFFANPGDFDGDGKHDFCIQRTRPGSATGGQFVLLKSSAPNQPEFIDWGLNNDLIVPGDYDGDAKADFAVVRAVGGNYQWWILTRTGATGGGTFGLATDLIAQGDYDGDGKTDLAVWRESANAAQNFFYVLNSSNGALQTFEWGQAGDVPAAGWNVH